MTSYSTQGVKSPLEVRNRKAAKLISCLFSFAIIKFMEWFYRQISATGNKDRFLLVTGYVHFYCFLKSKFYGKSELIYQTVLK